MKRVGSIIILLLLAIACAFACLLTAVGLETCLRQYAAQSFPKTEGRMVSSQAVFSGVTKHGAMIYQLALTYTYSVSGRDYTGRRYRYDDEPYDNDLVRQIVARHPAGSPVEVYYNPRHPDDAVLSPAVLGADVIAVFTFGTLFSSTLLILLRTVRAMDWPGASPPLAGGVKVISELTGVRVRLPPYWPGTAGWLTAAISSFGSAILVKIACNDSPLPAAWFFAGGIILASSLAYVWQRQRLASGRYDLVIHALDRTIELPRTLDTPGRRPRPFSSLARVILEKADPDNKSPLNNKYTPTLQFKDGQSVRLTELNQPGAEAFAAWLREKLALSE